MKDIKNGKLVKVGQTANKMQIKTGHIIWLEKETIKNIKHGKGDNENSRKNRYRKLQKIFN